MVQQSSDAVVLNGVVRAALWLRRPTKCLGISLRTAVVFWSFVVAMYSLIIGVTYMGRRWTHWDANLLIQTSCAFAFLTVVADGALIYGVLVKCDNILNHTLCAAMAAYVICLPLSLGCFIVEMALGVVDVPLWEVHRMVLLILHMGLMYCLLAEVRGELPLDDQSSSTPASEGWLKNNLACQGPPPPAGDEALLKVHVERDSPAILAPSSCTTAAPMHHPAPLAAVTADAGPPSSSEA